MNKIFYTYGHCVVLKGYRRSLLLDLQRNEVHPIPIALGELVDRCRDESLDQKRLEVLRKNNNLLIDEYIDFLEKNDIGSWVPISFREKCKIIDFEWDYPGAIIDGIIEVSVLNIDQLTDVLIELCLLGLRFVYFLIPNCSPTIVQKLSRVMEKSAIRGFNASIFVSEDEAKVRKLFDAEARMGQVQIFENKISMPLSGLRELFNQPPNKSSMVVNMKYYSEGLKFNPAFNRRVWISEDGLYYHSKYEGGGFSSLNELILSNSNKIATVVKDKVDVCCECEFRRSCYDTRTPVNRHEVEWYHTSECNYNPYICKWKEEEGYRTLAECGVASNAEGFTIDHDRIAAINAELWGE